MSDQQLHVNPNPQPPINNSKAITAMVLGILSLLVPFVGIVLGIIAIILGLKAMKEVPPNTPGGARGMALTGLICGIVGLTIYALYLIISVLLGAVFMNIFGEVSNQLQYYSSI